MKKFSKVIGIFLLVSVLLTGCAGDKSGADISTYPNKPVEVVVAFGAGGETDMVARLVFQYAEKYFGQSFAILNKAGASGEIGWTEVANAKPDGYTIAFINPPTFVTHPIQREGAKYKVEDFKIVANMVKDPACIIVRADSDIKDVNDLYAKAKDNDISIGYSGPGTSEALTLRQLDDIKGHTLEKIPYDGSAPSVVALLGGHIDAAILNVSGAINYTNDDSVRVISVASHGRVDDYPEVPTFEELGLKVFNEAYRGVAVPKDVPEEIVDKLEDSIKKALEDPDFIKRAEEMKIPLHYLNSEDFTKIINEIHEELVIETEKGEW